MAYCETERDLGCPIRQLDISLQLRAENVAQSVFLNHGGIKGVSRATLPEVAEWVIEADIDETYGRCEDSDTLQTQSVAIGAIARICTDRCPFNRI